MLYIHTLYTIILPANVISIINLNQVIVLSSECCESVQSPSTVSNWRESNHTIDHVTHLTILILLFIMVDMQLLQLISDHQYATSSIIKLI